MHPSLEGTGDTGRLNGDSYGSMPTVERFGVTIDWRGATIEGVAAIARQADDTGYGHLFIPEAWGLEAFSTIGHLLSITKRIKIGTGVVNIYSRSPATIAMSCATLNQLAPGRFELGLGTSGRGLVESWHGIKFERPFQRTKEYIDVIKKILSGQEAKYYGDILKLDRFRLFTRPPANEIEILLGAMGQKNLVMSGQVANGAIVVLYPISKLGQCVKAVNQNSNNPRKKVFVYLPLRITHSPDETLRARVELARYLSFYISSMGDYYSSNLSKLGYGDQIAKIRSVASERGSKEGADLIPEEFLEEFCLIGSPKEVLEKALKIIEGAHPVFGVKATSLAEGLESAKWLNEIAISSQS